MDAFVSRDAAHAAPWAAAPLAVAPAPGRVMKASAAASVGPKKKNKRTRPESVQALTVQQPEKRQRARRKDKTLYKNAVRAVEMTKKFPDQSLEERKGLLFCVACDDFVSFKEAVDVKQHVFGVQKMGEKSDVTFAAKTEEEKMKLAHYAGLVKIATEKRKATLVEAATALHREKIFAESNGTLAMRGESLPQDMMTDRVSVHLALLQHGIPISKLGDKGFVELIEKPHLSLGGLKGVQAVQPIVMTMAVDSVRAAVAGRLVSITFDGSKVNYSVEGMLARFLNDDFMPVSLCIGAQVLKTSLDSATMRSVIMKHLDGAGIAIKQIVAFSSDSGAPNPTVMAEWKTQAEALNFGQDLADQLVPWEPCLMHAFSNGGTKLRNALVPVKLFMSGFKTMVNESSASCVTWTRITGQACPGMSEKTFWSWYRRAVVLLDVWDKIPAFLAEATRRGLAKKSVAKMAEAWKNKTLRAELLFVKSFGKLLHDASYELEGDGFCVAFVHKHIALVSKLQQDVAQHGQTFRMITDAIATGMQDGLPNGAVDAFAKRLYAAAAVVMSHFEEAIVRKMKEVLPLYHAASLFEPQRFAVEWDKESFAANRPLMFDLLAGLKGVPAGVRSGLDAEFVLYETEVRDRLARLAVNPSLNSPTHLWMWWRGLRLKLPSFFVVASVLILMQPSSASIERFFSTVKANSSAQQNGESHETLALRCLCLYNTP